MLNLGTARLDHRFNDIFSLRNTLRFSHNDREHEVTAPRFNAATPGFFNRNRPKRDMTETILSNQTDLTTKFDTVGLQHTLATGIEFPERRWIEPTMPSPESPKQTLLTPTRTTAPPESASVCRLVRTAKLSAMDS